MIMKLVRIGAVFITLAAALISLSGCNNISLGLGDQPAIPTGLSLTPGNGTIRIAWTPVADATSYNIRWSNVSGLSSTNSTQVLSATNPYTLTGLSNGTPYYVVVTAVNATGESHPSAVASATPEPVPTGVTATPGNGLMTIAWIAVPGATSYNVYWSATAGVTPSSGTRITGASNPLLLTGLSNGTTYYAVVTAVLASGESAASFQVSATPTFGGVVAFTDYVGNWAGSWHNNTFGTSGPATLAVALDPTGTQMTWTIAVQGNVFGGAAPPPETFTGTVTVGGITLSGTSVSFGQLQLNIDPNGVVTGSGTNVNSPNVSGFIFSGNWTAGGFSLTYTASLTAGGTATGTFLMNKH